MPGDRGHQVSPARRDIYNAAKEYAMYKNPSLGPVFRVGEFVVKCCKACKNFFRDDREKCNYPGKEGHEEQKTEDGSLIVPRNRPSTMTYRPRDLVGSSNNGREYPGRSSNIGWEGDRVFPTREHPRHEWDNRSDDSSIHSYNGPERGKVPLVHLRSFMKLTFF